MRFHRLMRRFDSGPPCMDERRRCLTCGWPTRPTKSCSKCGAVIYEQPPVIEPGGEGDTLMVLMGLRSGAAPAQFWNRFLSRYDPYVEGVSEEGLPMLVDIQTTRDKDKAARFKDLLEARRAWMRWDGHIRPDGNPSRPLTAFNVEFVKSSYELPDL